MAVSDNDSRARMRSATHAAHVRVDACFPRGLASLSDYRQYLIGMHAVIVALEHGLQVVTLTAPWSTWTRPERIEWLVRDLADVGARPLQSGPPLQLDSVAEAAGALYVVEGSALGASQLLKDARALGLSEEHGLRFLSGHGGDGAGLRWREYVRCLESSQFGAAAERAMFEAAARAFAYVEHEFQRAAQQGGGHG